MALTIRNPLAVVGAQAAPGVVFEQFDSNGTPTDPGQAPPPNTQPVLVQLTYSAQAGDEGFIWLRPDLNAPEEETIILAAWEAGSDAISEVRGCYYIPLTDQGLPWVMGLTRPTAGGGANATITWSIRNSEDGSR